MTPCRVCRAGEGGNTGEKGPTFPHRLTLSRDTSHRPAGCGMASKFAGDESMVSVADTQGFPSKPQDRSRLRRSYADLVSEVGFRNRSRGDPAGLVPFESTGAPVRLTPRTSPADAETAPSSHTIHAARGTRRELMLRGKRSASGTDTDLPGRT